MNGDESLLAAALITASLMTGWRRLLEPEPILAVSGGDGNGSVARGQLARGLPLSPAPSWRLTEPDWSTQGSCTRFRSGFHLRDT